MTREEALVRVRGYLTDLIPIEDCDEVDEIMLALKQQPCEDCISRQAAIDAVETIGFDFSDSDLSEVELEEVCEAIGEVRQTWSQRIKRLPSVEPEKCSDCISRQAVLDLAERGKLVSNGNYKSVCDAINGLPSVEPERKPGKWIWEDGNIPYCSICKKYSEDADMQDIHGEVSYCSHCGAKMKGGVNCNAED